MFVAAVSGRFWHSITARDTVQAIKARISANARSPCCTVGGFMQQPRPESGKVQIAVAKTGLRNTML